MGTADLPNIFGKYDFSVVPLLLFAPDGSLYYAKDKSSIAPELREFHPDENYTNLNKIDIKAESLENRDEFASTF